MLTVLLSGCVYYPHLPDVPLISEKNDLRIDGGVSMIAVNATASYGVTENLAVQAFGTLGADHVHYYHGAAGIYKDLGNYRIMEIYGGVGHGYGDATNNSTGGRLSGHYQLYFTQFNIGKIKEKSSKYEFGFGLKTGYLHSRLKDYHYYFPPYLPPNEPYLEYRDHSLVVEPTAVLRLGGDHLKFSIKLGGCWIHKFTHVDKTLPYRYINLGLGLNYRL